MIINLVKNLAYNPVLNHHQNLDLTMLLILGNGNEVIDRRDIRMVYVGRLTNYRMI